MSKRIARISYSEMVRGQAGQETGRREDGATIDGGDDVLQYQSSEEESRWLSGAFTGHLKGDFSWNEHGEELQRECEGRVKIRDLGSNMVLIQSYSVKSTEEEIKALDEWAEFWLDWWRPWTYTDANLRRII